MFDTWNMFSRDRTIFPGGSGITFKKVLSALLLIVVAFFIRILVLIIGANLYGFVYLEEVDKQVLYTVNEESDNVDEFTLYSSLTFEIESVTIETYYPITEGRIFAPSKTRLLSEGKLLLSFMYLEENNENETILTYSPLPLLFNISENSFISLESVESLEDGYKDKLNDYNFFSILLSNDDSIENESFTIDNSAITIEVDVVNDSVGYKKALFNVKSHDGLTYYEELDAFSVLKVFDLGSERNSKEDDYCFSPYIRYFHYNQESDVVSIQKMYASELCILDDQIELNLNPKDTKVEVMIDLETLDFLDGN